MNIVKVHQAFAPKDFKEGQLVVDVDRMETDESVWCVQKVRSDGFLDLVEAAPPFDRKRNPRAEEMEPFYGTILIESKP